MTRHRRPTPETRRLVERLTVARIANGWTQRYVAEEMGVAAVLISQYEGLTRIPSTDRLIDWARALGREVTLAEVTDGS